MSISAPTSLPYRADVDGLRAVAVLLVLLFHAELGVSGGFVGVDVFFVLTGFLITGLLIGEMRAGTFSFRRFYLRRIRRLMPALVAAVFATVVAGFFLLAPEDLIALLDSSRYTLFSAGNVYFWLNTGGYFDADIRELPLMHTWSLGVEEQFYLIWPSLLLLAHRYLSPKRLLLVVAGVTLAGLAVSHWAALHTPGAAYYLLHGRMFEISIGALVALGSDRLPSLSRLGKNALSMLGACLILVPALVLDGRSTFPGVNALWPCAGTALLIITGGGQAGLVNRALSSKPLVALGLLSYSIYLWHWPIIAFLHYRGIEFGLLVRAMLVSAPIAAAALTYVLVERPFRYRLRYGFVAALLALTVTPAALSIGAHAVTRAQGGFPRRLAGNATALHVAEAAESGGGCRYNRDLSIVDQCVLGAKQGPADGLLVGDSYAGMYMHFIGVLAEDAGFSLRQRWYFRSAPIPGTCASDRFDPEQAAYTEKRHELLTHFEFGILSSSWGGYTYDSDSRLRLFDSRGDDVSARADALQLEAIDDLVKRGVKLILLDRPRAPPGSALMKKVRSAANRGESLAEYRVTIPPAPANYILDSVRRKYPSVLVIRPDDVICDDKTCAVALGDTVLYRPDGTHLTHEAATALAQKYLELRPNPLKSLQRTSKR